MVSASTKERVGTLKISEYPPSRYAWFVVFTLAVAFALSMLDRQIISLFVQPIKIHLQLTDTQFSLVAGLAFVLCYCTLGLVFGKLADSHNRRNTIVVGIIVWSLATMGCGVAQSFGELFAARMLIGVGEAALSPSAYSMIADYFPKEQRPRAVGIYTLGSLIGPGLGMMVISSVLRATANVTTLHVPLVGTIQTWQAAFILAALPALLLVPVLAAVKEPFRRDTKHTEGGSDDLRRFLRRKAPVLSLIIFSMSLNGLNYFCMTTWGPAVLLRRFQWSAAQVGMTFGVIQLTCATGGVLFGSWWVSRRKFAANDKIVFSTMRNVLLCMVVLALVLGFSAASVELTVLSISALIFAGGIVSGQAIVAIFHVTPNMFRGRVVSVNILMGAVLGLGIGATVVAGMTDYIFHDERAVGQSLAVVVLVASLFGSFLINRAMHSNELHMDW